MELAVACAIACDGDEPMLGNAKQYDGMGSMLAPIGYYYEPETQLHNYMTGYHHAGYLMMLALRKLGCALRMGALSG